MLHHRDDSYFYFHYKFFKYSKRDFWFRHRSELHIEGIHPCVICLIFISCSYRRPLVFHQHDSGAVNIKLIHSISGCDNELQQWMSINFRRIPLWSCLLLGDGISEYQTQCGNCLAKCIFVVVDTISRVNNMMIHAFHYIILNVKLEHSFASAFESTQYKLARVSAWRIQFASHNATFITPQPRMISCESNARI